MSHFAIVPAADLRNIDAAGEREANQFESRIEAELEIPKLRACSPDFDIDWTVVEVEDAASLEDVYTCCFGLMTPAMCLDEAVEQGITAQDYVSESLRVAMEQGLKVEDRQEAYCHLCKELGILSA